MIAAETDGSISLSRKGPPKNKQIWMHFRKREGTLFLPRDLPKLYGIYWQVQCKYCFDAYQKSNNVENEEEPPLFQGDLKVMAKHIMKCANADDSARNEQIIKYNSFKRAKNSFVDAADNLEGGEGYKVTEGPQRLKNMNIWQYFTIDEGLII